MNWRSYKPYVPVAERKLQALKTINAQHKQGKNLNPVQPEGRKIARSFWGSAWCEHLESFSDYENRLPRGRTYLRNGSVIHLAIETGRINALVQGSSLYTQTIEIAPLSPSKWETLKKRCQGKVGSLLELLQGRISDEVMAMVTDRTQGLFPSPKEIKTDCDCPDWAGLCKHLAAVLYGVGTLLDRSPELLFKLRGVDHSELIQVDTDALVQASKSGSRRRLASAALGDVFGIDLDEPTPAVSPAAVPKKKTAPKAKKRTRKASAKPGAKARQSQLTPKPPPKKALGPKQKRQPKAKPDMVKSTK